MLIRVLALTPEGLLLASVCFLVTPWYLGKLRNSPLFLGLMLKLSIWLWLQLPVSWFGSNNFWLLLVFSFLLLPYFFLIIKQLCIFASNPTFHEWTKHIEIDCHFVRDNVVVGCIRFMPIQSQNQLANMFTKPLAIVPFFQLISKMAVKDIHCPSWGGVLE